jgi:hypothetical protein
VLSEAPGAVLRRAHAFQVVGASEQLLESRLRIAAQGARLKVVPDELSSPSWRELEIVRGSFVYLGAAPETPFEPAYVTTYRLHPRSLRLHATSDRRLASSVSRSTGACASSGMRTSASAATIARSSPTGRACQDACTPLEADWWPDASSKRLGSCAHSVPGGQGAEGGEHHKAPSSPHCGCLPLALDQRAPSHEERAQRSEIVELRRG